MSTLKEVITEIGRTRQLTQTDIAMILRITPSYFSQIINKGVVPKWFVSRINENLALSADELAKLTHALHNLFLRPEETDKFKKRALELKEECIAKLLALVGAVVSLADKTGLAANDAKRFAKQQYEAFLAFFEKFKILFDDDTTYDMFELRAA